MATLIPGASSIALFQGRATSAQTFSTVGVNTPINLAAEDFDDLNGHSTSTQTSRYVCQRAGLYLVAGSVIVTGSATTTAGTLFRVAGILKNGALIPGCTSWGVNLGNTSTISLPLIPTLVTLALNDYVELSLNTGLSGTTTTADSSNCPILRVDFVR